MAMVYQKGTVYLKGTREKKWYGKFRVYLQDQDGKESEKTRKVVIGPKAKMRKFEAEARLQEIIRQNNGGMLEGGTELAFDDSVTFDWFVENRYFPMREGRWRPATKKTTEFEIRRYLVSALGSKPMRTLNTFELQVVLNKLAQTYSDSVVRHAYVNLKSILKTARKLKFVPENPGEDLAMPDTKTVEKPTLSMDQIVALVSAVTDPHDLCLLCIGIFCGTRTSEVLGLQWKSWQGDYLLPFGTAHEGQFFAGKLKTGASRDAIPVPEPIRKVIAAWQRQCEDPSPEAFMFATFGRGDRLGSDVPRHGKNFLRWRIHPIAEKLEIPTRLITFQVMRRTLGTDLQKYGTLKDAQRILRHADIKTTGNVYMQAIPESVMKAINKRTKAVLKGQVIEGRSVTVPNGSQLRLKESVSA
jgi:integrase